MVGDYSKYYLVRANAIASRPIKKAIILLCTESPSAAWNTYPMKDYI